MKHASLQKNNKRSTVSVANKDGHFTYDAADIMMITEARVEELLEYVDRELHKIHRSRKLPGGAVLSGGTAKLPGMAEFTRDNLQLAARVGKIQPLTGLVDTVDDPSYYAAIGLMLLDMLLLPDAHHEPNQHQSTFNVPGVLDNFLGYFKRH